MIYEGLKAIFGVKWDDDNPSSNNKQSFVI